MDEYLQLRAFNKGECLLWHPPSLAIKKGAVLLNLKYMIKKEVQVKPCLPLFDMSLSPMEVFQWLSWYAVLRDSYWTTIDQCFRNHKWTNLGNYEAGIIPPTAPCSSLWTLYHTLNVYGEANAPGQGFLILPAYWNTWNRQRLLYP